MIAQCFARPRWGMAWMTGLASLLAVTGCGGNPNLSGVTGKITLDGSPLAGAFVKFVPDSGGTTSFGKTDAEGMYEMQFTDKEKGAWKGQNRVEISTWDVGGSPERVPSAYNKDTTLTVDVQPGKNEFDFDLKSDASSVEQPVDE